jgi:site-specific recombinase XerD
MQIEEAMERFIQQLQANGRSAHTAKQASRHVRSFASWLRDKKGGTRIEDITHEIVAEFFASIGTRNEKTGVARMVTTQNIHRGSLKNFLGFLHRAGYSGSDLGRLIQRARCSPLRPRGLSEDEQRKLLGALVSTPERDRVLVLMLLGAGLRIGAALALDIEDLDLERGELTVRAGKGGQGDRFPIGPGLRRELAGLVSGRSSGPVFVGRAGGRMTRRHAARRFRAVLDLARICRAASLHTLRHTFAEGVLARTGSVFAVKEALGHKSILSSMVYLEGQREAVRRAAMV